MGFLDSFNNLVQKGAETVAKKKAEVEARYVEFQGKSSEELKDIARSGSSYSGMARKILQDRGEL
nr:hypothetical protein [uncultured Campylobacter sp.]